MRDNKIYERWVGLTAESLKNWWNPDFFQIDQRMSEVILTTQKKICGRETKGRETE